MADYVKFLRGTLAGYKAVASPDANTFYITTDEGAIYLGTKRLGDYVTVANVDALPAANSVSTSALYYAVAENVLARSNGNSWVQINAAGLTKVVCADQGGTPTGNVLASIYVSTDATTGAKVLTYTTASVATSEGLANLTTRVGTAESKLTTIQGTGDGSITKAVADAKSAILGGATEGTDTIASIKTAAANAQKAADDAQDQADTNKGDINTLKGQVGTGTVDSRINAAKTALLGSGAVEGTDTIASVKGLANTGIANAATAQAAAEAAQGTANTANTQANTNKGDIAGLKTLTGTHTSQIAVLEQAIGEGGSVDDRLAALKKEILTGDSTETLGTSYDTLLEVSQWISEHGNAAGEMATQINTNKSDINTLKGQVGTGTVDSRITTAKNAVIGNANDAASVITVYGAHAAAAAASTAAGNAQTRADNAYNLANTANTQATTNKTDIGNLKNQVGTGTVDSRINAAKEAVLGTNSDAAGAATVAGANKAAAAASTAAGNAQTKADSAYNLANTANTQANTNKGDIASLKTEKDNLWAQLEWGTF